MSEISPEKIDVSKIKIVVDKASFTGYSIVPLDPNAEGGMSGVPASLFEVALWKENQRLMDELEKVRTFIKNIRAPVNDEQWDLEEIAKKAWAQTLSDLDVAASESVAV